MRPITRFILKRDLWSEISIKLLLASAIALGVTALVALDSFSRRIESTVTRDTKALLAADYQIQAFREFEPKVLRSLERIAGLENIVEQNDLVATVFSKEHEPLTVSLRALKGAYPFYGNFIVDPPQNIASLAESPKILVDAALQARGFKLGDILTLGQLDFKISGFIKEEPQSVATAFALGPRMIISVEQLKKTGLVTEGSRVFRMLLVKSELNTKRFRQEFRKDVPEPHWRLITPERANQQSASVVERIRRFLSFVALAAVFLGAAGVFMIFRSRFLTRLPEFLSLRCLGMRERDLYSLSLIEALLLALVGGSLGGLFGSLLENRLSHWASTQMGISLAPVHFGAPLLYGYAVAFLTVVAGVLTPLQEILRVPLAQAFQQQGEARSALKKRDALVLSLLAFVLTWIVGRELSMSLYFLAALGFCALLLLAGSSFLVRTLKAPVFRSSFSLKHAFLQATRQVASFRLTVLCVGLGVFLVSSILFISQALRRQVDMSHRIGIPNLFFLSVGATDRDVISRTFQETLGNTQAAPDFVPITQARLTSLDGKPIEESRDDESAERRRFLETREYVITRRDGLGTGEVLRDSLVKGQLFGAPEPSLVRLSLERDFSERIGLKLGSRLTLSLAGVELQARVDSLRTVDWFNFKPNFFIIAHPNDLADAPMDYVGFARVDATRISELQNKIAKLLPQVSAIDGNALSRRLIDLLGKLSFAVYAVSLFSLGSCLFVFTGIVIARRPQKVKEIALWRCLGLSKARVRQQILFEFFLSGFLASASGLIAAVAATWMLCRFQMEIPYVGPSNVQVLAALFVPGIFLAILGWLLVRGLMKISPAQIFLSAGEG